MTRYYFKVKVYDYNKSGNCFKTSKKYYLEDQEHTTLDLSKAINKHLKKFFHSLQDSGLEIYPETISIKFE